MQRLEAEPHGQIQLSELPACGDGAEAGGLLPRAVEASVFGGPRAGEHGGGGEESEGETGGGIRSA